MSCNDDFVATVDEMHNELMSAFPDLVDVYEDMLARDLGLERGPGLELGNWRRLRVRFIDASGNNV